MYSRKIKSKMAAMALTIMVSAASALVFLAPTASADPLDWEKAFGGNRFKLMNLAGSRSYHRSVVAADGTAMGESTFEMNFKNQRKVDRPYEWAWPNKGIKLKGNATYKSTYGNQCDLSKKLDEMTSASDIAVYPPSGGVSWLGVRFTNEVAGDPGCDVDMADAMTFPASGACGGITDPIACKQFNRKMFKKKKFKANLKNTFTTTTTQESGEVWTETWTWNVSLHLKRTARHT